MITNYFRTAFRILIKSKLFSIINILGLAVGLACSIIIFMWINNEKSYDDFVENVENKYRIVSLFDDRNWMGTPGLISQLSTEQLPGINAYTRIFRVDRTLIESKSKEMYEKGGICIDSTFFSFFNYKFLYGSETSAFDNLHSIVIAKSFAERYFGKAEVLGEILKFDGNNFIISGILENIPDNSHIKFDFALSYEFLMTEQPLHWGHFMHISYVELNTHENIDTIAAKITGIAAKNKCPQVLDGLIFSLQALKEVHFHIEDDDVYEFYDTTNKTFIKVFSIISIFILVIACINYINLTTARSEQRGKEIGMRKTVGATKKQLYTQFFIEIVLQVFIAINIAVILVERFLPMFNQLTEKNLSISYSLTFFLILLLLLVVVSFFSGIFPALILSSLKPISLVKGSLSNNKTNGQNYLRKLFMIIQFVVTMILITSTIIIYYQFQFIKNKDKGFDSSNIITIPITESIGKSYNMIKSELMSNVHVKYVSNQDFIWAIDDNSCDGCVDYKGRDPKLSVDLLLPQVGFDYFELLNIPMVDGRSFSTDYSTDTNSAFILNEKAVEMLEIDTAVGTPFALYGYEGLVQKGHIVGVCKNVNFKPLYEEIRPQAIRVFNKPYEYTDRGAILIKTDGKDNEAVVDYIMQLWEKYNNTLPFEYKYLDHLYENTYKQDSKLSSVINYFALLAILISSLGLFALATYDAQKRRKEISIRKVNGASTVSLFWHFSLNYLKWIVISILLASPIIYYYMSKWLENFAFQIKLSFLYFFLGGFITVAIAILTVSFQIYKASVANPADNLRYE